jgi:signal recognition particle receptor subunit beta
MDAVLIAVVVVIITTVVLFLLRARKGASRTKIVIVGPCGAGKTLLFSQIVNNKFVETQTSLEENSGDVPKKLREKVCNEL